MLEFGRLRGLLAALLLGTAISTNVHGQCQSVKIVPSPGFGGGERYGDAIAVSGEWMMVGAYRNDEAASQGGVVYVHRLIDGAWVEQQKLFAPSPNNVYEFGRQIAIEGDVALFGVPNDDTVGLNAGAVHVFRLAKGAWSYDATLTVTDGGGFGDGLVLQGGVAVIGAAGDDEVANGAGAAYVFEWEDDVFVERTKLTAPDGIAGDQFGGAVTLDGALIAVGAVAEDGPAGPANSGAVYVFTGAGGPWTFEKKLVPPVPSGELRFGADLALAGDCLVIGAFGDDEVASNAGAIHVHERQGGAWPEVQKVTADSGLADDRIGAYLKLAGDRMLTGAWSNGTIANEAGAAYVFERIGCLWMETAQLFAADADANDEFGHGLALTGSTAFIGATKDEANKRSGSVYVFDLADPVGTDCNGNGTCDADEILSGAPDCNGNLVLDACEIAAADVADRDGNGVPDACDPDCNANGVPDACDLLAGTSADVDANTVPDECDPLLPVVSVEVSDGATLAGPLVAIDGDVVVIGLPGARIVQVHRRDGGTWTAGPDLAPGDGDGGSFGAAVDVEGDLVIVGAPSDATLATSSGAAYVFRWDGAAWNEEAKLTASDGGSFDLLGSDVAITGDLAVAGAPGNNDQGFGTGAAYAFRFDGATWTETHKLTEPVPDNDQRFGAAVDAAGDLVVVGTPLGDGGLYENLGSAYVFRFQDDERGGAWLDEGELRASDPLWPASFGAAVDTDGVRIIVGAPDGSGDGAAYVFARVKDAWIEEADLRAPYDDFDIGDEFGAAVAIDGNRIVVGAPYDDDDDEDSGSAMTYRFCGTAWALDARLTIAALAGDDNLGTAVAVSGETAVVAAMQEDGPSPDTLQVAFYEPLLGAPLDCDGNGIDDRCDLVDGDRPDCNRNGVVDACDIASGTSTDCDGDGLPDECVGRYRLDDGTAETGVGFIGQGYDTIWFNRFTIRPGEEWIDAIRIAVYELPVGLPMTLFLHRDPSDDGDATDAVLLRTVEAQTAGDGLVEYVIEPTEVGAAGESFFVGAAITGVFEWSGPCAMDTSAYRAESFLGAGQFGNANLDDLSLNPFIPGLAGHACCPGNWLIRAVAMGAASPCVCPADLDGSDHVGFGDLATLLSVWGPCPPGPCSADFSGNGQIGLDDLAALLAAWGACP